MSLPGFLLHQTAGLRGCPVSLDFICFVCQAAEVRSMELFCTRQPSGHGGSPTTTLACVLQVAAGRGPVPSLRMGRVKLPPWRLQTNLRATSPAGIPHSFYQTGDVIPRTRSKTNADFPPVVWTVCMGVWGAVGVGRRQKGGRGQYQCPSSPTILDSLLLIHGLLKQQQ